MNNKILTLDKKHKFTLERVLGEYKKKQSDPIDVIRRVRIAHNLKKNPSNITPCDLIEIISILDELVHKKKISKELVIELKIDIAEVMKNHKIVLIGKETPKQQDGHKLISKHKAIIY